MNSPSLVAGMATLATIVCLFVTPSTSQAQDGVTPQAQDGATPRAQDGVTPRAEVIASGGGVFLEHSDEAGLSFGIPASLSVYAGARVGAGLFGFGASFVPSIASVPTEGFSLSIAGGARIPNASPYTPRFLFEIGGATLTDVIRGCGERCIRQIGGAVTLTLALGLEIGEGAHRLLVELAPRAMFRVNTEATERQRFGLMLRVGWVYSAIPEEATE